MGVVKTNAQITVDTGFNATQLAQKLVGGGLTVFNAKLVAVSNQCGVFKATPNALPLDSGVVLTNGKVKGDKGISWFLGTGGCDNILGTLGDSSLNALFGFTSTHDACVLEFDFIPVGDSLNFRYLFSSAEYSCCVCSPFNDAFAFIISGPGFNTATNIALVPGTNIPVSVNSINSGVAGPYSGAISTCTAMGLGSPFTTYFTPHVLHQFLNHYARTKVLVARAKVQPCQVYHIKLVIADVMDGRLDSGVFLEAGSFNSPKSVSIYTDSTYTVADTAVLVERCKPQGKIKIVRSAANNITQPFSVALSYSGTATYGVDYNAADTIVNFVAYQDTATINLNIVDDGVGDDDEYIIVKVKQANGCNSAVSIDSVLIKIKESWIKSSKTDTLICKNVGKVLKSSFADSTNTNFLWNSGEITASNNITISGNHWVNAIQKNTCIQSDTFNVVKDNFTVKTSANDSICKGDSIKITYTSNQPVVSRFWSSGNSDSLLTVISAGKYLFTALNNKGCFDKDSTQITYKISPSVSLPTIVNCCVGDSVLLDASQNAPSVFNWSNGSNSSSIYVKVPDAYYVVVTRSNGCKNSDTSTLSYYEMPTVNAGADVQMIKGNTVVLNATASSNAIKYLWQPATYLNNANILNPTATVAKDIMYKITVYTANNCEATDSLSIQALEPGIDIPNVFSPNGDGKNDAWEILSLLAYPQASVNIFDRYGREVFHSIGYKKPWNGTSQINGEPLPVGTYYYIIKTNVMGNSQSISGTVIILR